MVSTLTATASTLIGQKLNTLYMLLCSAAAWIVLLNRRDAQLERWLHEAFTVPPGWYGTAQDYLQTHSPATWETTGTVLVVVGLMTATAQGLRSLGSKAGASTVLGLSLLGLLGDGLWTACVLGLLSAAGVAAARRYGEHPVSLDDSLLPALVGVGVGLLYIAFKAWDVLTNDTSDDEAGTALSGRLHHIERGIERLANASERITPPPPQGVGRAAAVCVEIVNSARR